MAHRPELSLKDALQGSCFTQVDEMLLRFYYLSENSPKKLRQLRELYDIYKLLFQFKESGVRPKRASGRTCAVIIFFAVYIITNYTIYRTTFNYD